MHVHVCFAPNPLDGKLNNLVLHTEACQSALLEALKTDMKRFSDLCPTGEIRVTAFGYWLYYPFILSRIFCEVRPETIKYSLIAQLDTVYSAATNVLMHEAGRNGLDPALLFRCSRVVQATYRESPERITSIGNSDVWPDCMEAWRYELPDKQQEALAAGESEFIRLTVLLDNAIENEGTLHLDNTKRNRKDNSLRAVVQRVREIREMYPGIRQSQARPLVGCSKGQLSKAWNVVLSDEREKSKPLPTGPTVDTASNGLSMEDEIVENRIRALDAEIEEMRFNPQNQHKAIEHLKTYLIKYEELAHQYPRTRAVDRHLEFQKMIETFTSSRIADRNPTDGSKFMKSS